MVWLAARALVGVPGVDVRSLYRSDHSLAAAATRSTARSYTQCCLPRASSQWWTAQDGRRSPREAAEPASPRRRRRPRGPAPRAAPPNRSASRTDWLWLNYEAPPAADVATNHFRTGRCGGQGRPARVPTSPGTSSTAFPGSPSQSHARPSTTACTASWIVPASRSPHGGWATERAKTPPEARALTRCSWRTSTG